MPQFQLHYLHHTRASAQSRAEFQKSFLKVHPRSNAPKLLMRPAMFRWPFAKLNQAITSIDRIRSINIADWFRVVPLGGVAAAITRPRGALHLSRTKRRSQTASR